MTITLEAQTVQTAPTAQTVQTTSTEQLVLLAREGDARAYEQLVERHQRQVWAAVRGFRLSDADAHDAVQMTWLRLVENLDRLNDPSRLGAWLTTTAKRECLRLLRRRNREIGTPDEYFDAVIDERQPNPEQQVTQAAMAEVLWDFVGELPTRAQDLLHAVTSADRPAYAEISKATGMAVGSIGPTRGRYLTRLRKRIEESGLDAAAFH